MTAVGGPSGWAIKIGTSDWWRRRRKRSSGTSLVSPPPAQSWKRPPGIAHTRSTRRVPSSPSGRAAMVTIRIAPIMICAVIPGSMLRRASQQQAAK